MRRLGLILLAMLLISCHSVGSAPRLRLPEKPDDFDRFGALMRDETGFYDELKRLQALYTAPPDPAYAAPADFDMQYTLSSRVEKHRAGLVLTDRRSGEEWVLWTWQNAGASNEGQPGIAVMRDEATAGGYRLDLSLGNGALALSFNARWVQGRYLQVTRELILGGLDTQAQADAGAAGWVLDGPWLPYRMLPACTGPFGVIPDAEADGAWHSANYPFGAMVPAVAAYDRRHGALLAVVDEHPRKADRSYTVSYRIPPDRGSGAQLALSYRCYDTTADSYTMPYMSSGLPLRDSIVIAPLKLNYASIDPTLVEAETVEVIQQLGQLSRAYHFVPKPPKSLEPGGFVRLTDWVGAANDPAELLRQAGGVWGCRYAAVEFADAKLDARGMAGIGAADLTGGGGLGALVTQMLAGIPQDVLPVLVVEQPLAWHKHNAYARACPSWLALDAQDGAISQGDFLSSGGGSNEALLDIRNPQVATWAARKLAGDLEAYPQVAGYSIRGTGALNVSGQAQSQGPFLVSYPAAACALYLRSAEAERTARATALLASDKGLRLCLSAFANCYENGDGVFGIRFGQQGTPPPVPFENRLSNDVFWEVFGVKPYACFGGADLASQVLATTPCINGHGILRVQQGNAGFESYATHQLELRSAGGELLVLHSLPEKSTYTGGPERPAVCSELVSILPADWDGAESVWIAFHGMGGSVSVDLYNHLTVRWGAGLQGSWTRALPVGYWIVEHPSPQDVQPGDAVLVLQRPLPPIVLPGTDQT